MRILESASLAVSPHFSTRRRDASDQRSARREILPQRDGEKTEKKDRVVRHRIDAKAIVLR